MIQDEHNPEGTDHAAQGHALAASKATPPAAAPTPTPPDALPQVVWQATMSAICEYENQTGKVIYDGNLLHGLVCAALAPLWPRRVPVTTDTWELANQILDAIDETPKFNDPALRVGRVIAPVLARAEAAERERDQLRAEVKRLADVERELTFTLRDANINTAEAVRERDQLRAQLAAAQAQARAATKHKNTLLALVERYLKETPLGHQPSMIALEAERAIDAARREGGAK